MTQTCQVTDPNSLLFCDQTQYHVPLKSSFRAGGTYKVHYGVLLSAVFQSSPNAPTLGDDTLQQNYIVNRTIVPNLTQTSVTVPLNAPGTSYRQRINQLDMTIGKEFRVGKNRLLPKVEFFNLLNANPVLAENQTLRANVGAADSGAACEVFPGQFESGLLRGPPRSRLSLSGAKTRTGSRCAHVFVHKPAKVVAASHLDRLTVTFGVDCQRTIRWDQTEAPMRSRAVVLPDGREGTRRREGTETDPRFKKAW